VHGEVIEAQPHEAGGSRHPIALVVGNLQIGPPDVQGVLASPALQIEPGQPLAPLQEPRLLGDQLVIGLLEDLILVGLPADLQQLAPHVRGELTLGGAAEQAQRLFDLAGLAEDIDPDLPGLGIQPLGGPEAIDQGIELVITTIGLDQDGQGVAPVTPELGASHGVPGELLRLGPVAGLDGPLRQPHLLAEAGGALACGLEQLDCLLLFVGQGQDHGGLVPELGAPVRLGRKACEGRGLVLVLVLLVSLCRNGHPWLAPLPVARGGHGTARHQRLAQQDPVPQLRGDLFLEQAVVGGNRLLVAPHRVQDLRLVEGVEDRLLFLPDAFQHAVCPVCVAEAAAVVGAHADQPQLQRPGRLLCQPCGQVLEQRIQLTVADGTAAPDLVAERLRFVTAG
jgi:hypothetical protein